MPGSCSVAIMTIISARHRACVHAGRPFKNKRLELSKVDLMKEIESYRALLLDLMYNTIPARKRVPGQGRFQKYETAKKDYILNSALPGLEFGAFPSDYDDTCLFMPGANEVNEAGEPKLKGVDKETMEGIGCVQCFF